MVKKILLLNPPGEKLYIRDYYCSKVSKSNYLFHPIDLLMLSGRLAERYDIKVIDAIADRIEKQRCISLIDAISPDVIISLIGAVSFEEDLAFFKMIKKERRQIVVSGDVTLEDNEELLKDFEFIDAIVLDFTSGDIISYLDCNFEAATGIVYRINGNICKGNYTRHKNNEFTLPIPRHELFSSGNYRFPFVRHKNFATVLTSYGCPFNCSFCVMSTLGYRYRTVDNVLEEFKVLKKLGKKEVFVFDQTFGVNKKRTLDICRGIEGDGFGFVCYSRVDVLTEDLLEAMKAAGCHTIIFGVESSSEEILKHYKKGYTKTQIRKTFELCRKYKIRTVGTFIIGLPEESEDTANETTKFLKEIDCDFASFNVAVPRMNTGLRLEAIKEGLLKPGLKTMDQTGTYVVMPSKYLTPDQIQSLKRKAIRKFYLRPTYLLKRLTTVKTMYELKEQIVEGWHLLKKFLV